jgi:tRNA (guanine37-N1)-methyltransferase
VTTAYAWVVPLVLGEDAKRLVRALGIGRADLKIGRRDGHILIPLSRPADPPLRGILLEVAEFNSTRPPKSYKDVVQVPDRVRPQLPTSFDIVGDLVLIKVPADLRVYGPAIADAILKVHKNVKGVFHDEGVQGAFRIRQLVPLAGVTRTRTTHTEFATPLAVDLARAYFSPRLANEHDRVARAVQPGELVLDLTAGVGPFTIMIAKLRRAARVIAVDLNPDAVVLLKENVATHRVPDKVEVVQEDATAFLGHAPAFDRALVNLPHGGEDILAQAAARAKDGCVLHYYRVWPEADRESRTQDLLANLSEAARRPVTLVDQHVVHAYSPADRLYSMDLRVG